ncbi:hypothetical protein C8N35_110123 [Breoghania corrubedonensis]|uniref:Methyltransferase family protein n=1 Tax=Breoghania corrubedonensis TaxID=665038 RepID=A0A2T5V1K6_9HYPH|nr:class I SAM-dependent methyltransferase [Breoghania corrubedonensis]PTW57644.1 hypothetical protein C8N35_110123 [Breoghania corrubedonensis]
MVTNIKKQREEYLEKVTEAEAEKLAIRFGAGHDHWRTWVGPPMNYDVQSAMQFQLLTNVGLREYHRLLEVGCGSLRAGRLFITYLLEGRYYGVEPNEKIMREGVVGNFGAELENSPIIKDRKPSFSHNSDFDFSFTESEVDFAIAQSIASHTGPAELKRLLTNLAQVSHDGTLCLVTYGRILNPVNEVKEDGWYYPECVAFTPRKFSDIAKNSGFNHMYHINWPLMNVSEDGTHTTTQQIAVLTKRPWKAPLSVQVAGVAGFRPIEAF